MKNNLFKKFLSFSYGSWIGMVFGVLITMITTRILSPEHFGKASMYTLAINVLMIFIIFGTDQSFVRFFYEEEEEKRGGLLYNCIRIPIIIAFFTIITILLFNQDITKYLFGEPNLLLAIALIFGILFESISRYSILIIRMNQKGHLFSILQIIRKIVEFGVLLLFYSIYGNKYEIIIFSTIVTSMVITMVSIYFEKEFWSLKNYGVKDLRHSKIDIFKYAYPLVLTTLISWLFTSFDKIALKQWSTFAELGLYAAASKIVALLIVLQGTFTTFWTPVCYEKFEEDPEDKDFFERTSKIITLSMFFLAIISIMGKDLIVILLGLDYREASNIMPFLVFMPIMYTISETTVIGINFFKKPNWHILIATVSCLTNILGNWILVPKMGARGAAISTAFSYIVFFTLRTTISLKYYKVNYDLRKIYLMLGVISVYAIYSTFKLNIIMNLIIGCIVIVFMVFIYYKDIRYIYNNMVKDILIEIRKKFFKR